MTLYLVLNVIGGPFSSFLTPFVVPFVVPARRDLVSAVKSLLELYLVEVVRFGGEGSFFSFSFSSLARVLPIVV